MRVVAGRWRGRRLVAPPGRDLRPTTDRAKEAAFSILGPRVAGAVAVDLCCGAGGLGIEALSRGAAAAHLVDRSPAALAAARANLERCGADAGSYRLHRADCRRWLARLAAAAAGRPAVVLADPPYGSGLAAELAAALAAMAPGRPVVAAIVESGPDLAPPPGAGAAGWRCRQRRLGAALLTILEA